MATKRYVQYYGKCHKAASLSARAEDQKARNVAEGLKVVKVVLFGLAVAGIMAFTSGCNTDPVKSAQNVVECYNETGMGTSCLYHEVTSK